MHRFCLIFVFLFSSQAFADDLSVKTLTIKNADKERGVTNEYSMPFIETKAGNLAARLNDFIFINELETLAPDKLKDAKYKPTIEDGPTELGFEVLRNDGKILSLSIDKEGCGAYCESYSTYYNFDAKTGASIGLMDLFTFEGWEALKKQLVTERQAQIKKAIAGLNEQIKKEKDPDGDYAAMIQQYEECTSLIADPAYASKAFSIGDKSVTFIRERCSNHALRALDDLGDFANAHDFNSLKPYLTAYGKALLLNEGSTDAPKSPFRQVLHGTVGGKQAITVLLKEDEYTPQAVNGIYFYDKYRQSIALKGTWQGDTLTLTEADKDGKTVATIKLNIVQDSLKGEWSGKTKLGFEAAP